MDLFHWLNLIVASLADVRLDLRLHFEVRDECLGGSLFLVKIGRGKFIDKPHVYLHAFEELTLNCLPVRDGVDVIVTYFEPSRFNFH
jgi:hypothetical protein